MTKSTLTNRLRGRAAILRRRQGGFTLLELLVVVAILAAVAGTATIALQDTDARAAAAAHVAMMDELNKGIRTFRVLNNNAYPDNFDSLLQWDGTAANLAALSNFAVDAADFEIVDPPETAGGWGQLLAERLGEIGLTNVRIVNTTLDPAGDQNCTNLQNLINSRGNAVVAGNIYLSPVANGCGEDLALVETNDNGTPTDTSDDFDSISANARLVLWTGGTERITGQPVAADYDGTALGGTGVTTGTPLFMMVGIGPSSTLFDVRTIGGMTTVPVYRHVGDDEYNRFLALFHVANTTATAGAPAVVDQVLLQTIIDGAGDTKEEELGEWDGTRNTI